MLKKDIRVGGHYLATVSGKLTTVRVDAIREDGVHLRVGGRSTINATRYGVTNLATGRRTTFRSAQKFRQEVKDVGTVKCLKEGINPAFVVGTPEEADRTAEYEAADKAEVAQEQTPFSIQSERSTMPSSASPTAMPCSAPGSSQQATTPPSSPVVAAAAPAASSLGAALSGANGEAKGPPHVIVVARAGSGKTTTLVEGLKEMKGIGSKLVPSPQQRAVWDAICQSRGARSVCFVAFNKSIATELQQRVPQGCDAMTMHSLGYKAVRKAWGRVDLNEYVVADHVCDLLGMDSRDARKEHPVLLQATVDLVGLCKMNLVHPWDKDVDFEEALSGLASHHDVETNGCRDRVFQLVPDVLQRCRDPRGRIDFDDMIWLPVVHSLPLFRYDLLLVDEAQDLNRCQQALAKAAGRRLVLCGDPCQPPDTLVARLVGRPRGRHEAITEQVPISEIKQGDYVWGYCMKDCRFYAARQVQGVSKRQFSGDLVTASMESVGVSRYTPNHLCIASFAAMRHCWVVYLMAKGSQYRIGMSRVEQAGNQGSGPFMRLRNERGDHLWILEFYESREEAKVMEQAVSGKFGLPQLMFNPEHFFNPGLLSRAWDFIGNNTARAQECLLHFGKDIRYPLVSSSDKAFIGQSTLPSLKRPMVVRAANLVNGCLMLPWNGENTARKANWRPVEISREAYSGPVWSLDIDGDHTYIADGIVTHNCQAIYGFAGADAESMPRMTRELTATSAGCVELPLTVTRRCGKAIVEEARSGGVTDFEAHESCPPGKVGHAPWPIKEVAGAKTEVPWEQSYCGQVKVGDMVLCRVNAPLVGQCFRFLKRGIKANIQGRDVGRGLASLVKKMKAHDVPDLIGKLSDWLAKEQRSENAKRNPSENKLIALEDKHDCVVAFCDGQTTVDGVLAKIDSVFTDNKDCPGVRFSSIHKAKGLEADNVFFLMPNGAACPHPMAKKPWAVEQEHNLLYVGRTRAIHTLIYVS